ncbi:MAG: bacterial Ig-like domain-containing protein [Oscillospiraceae bacterium]|nr:bacterial Ig-like domain-containing protein [Oscillospiraceae bacterium]
MKKSKKIISFLLVFIIAISSLPITRIAGYTANEKSGVETISNDDADNYEFLGSGFNALSKNALSKKEVSVSNLITENKTVDITKVDGKILNIYSGEGHLYRESSMTQLLESMDVSCTTSFDVTLPLNILSLGIHNKFTLTSTTNTDVKYTEAYTYYQYRFSNVLYKINENLSSTEYFTDSFRADLANLSAADEKAIEAFFDKYGTHILMSYVKGGEADFAAQARTESTSTEESKAFNESFSVGVKDIADISSEIKKYQEKISKSSEIESVSHWFTTGGNAAFLNENENSGESETITINTGMIQKWVDSIRDREAFLPATTKWVAIWDILPAAEYAEKRAILYNYFVSKATDDIRSFFDKYSSFRGEYMVSGIKYVSPSNYVFSFTDKNYTNLKNVAPGSIIMLSEALDGSLTGADIYHEVSDNASIDVNGVLRVSENAKEGEIIELRTMVNGYVIKNFEFTVKKEGKFVNNTRFYSGGYGTAEMPYLLSNKDDILSLKRNDTDANSPYKYFILTNDISLKGSSTFTGIESFSAHLDGNGYAITDWELNYKYSSPAPQELDLSLGFIGINNGTIENISFRNCSVSCGVPEHKSAKHYLNLGIAVGRNSATVRNVYVYNCTVKANYLGSTDSSSSGTQSKESRYYARVGGVIGVTEEGSVVDSCGVKKSTVGSDSRCSSWSRAYAFAGGVIGAVGINAKTCTNIFSYDNTVTAKAQGSNDKGGTYAYAGGIAGYLYEGAQIKYAVSNKKGTASVKDGNKSYRGVQGDFIIGYSEDNNAVSKGYTDNTSPQPSDKWCLDWDSSAGEWPYLIYTPDLISGKTTSLSLNPTDASCVSGTVYNLNELTVSWNEKIIDKYSIVNFPPPSVLDTYTATVYAYEKSAGFNVTVNQKTAVGIRLYSLPYKTEYFEGEEFDPSGLSLALYYDDGSFDIIEKGFSWEYTGRENEKQTVEVEYRSYSTASFTINIYPVEPIRLVISRLPEKLDYAIGDPIDTSGIELQLFYTNGKNTETVTGGFSVQSVDTSNAGEQTVELSYKGLSVSYRIIVGKVSSIKMVSMPLVCTYYTSSRKLDLTGLEIIAKYENNVEKTVTDGFTVSQPDFSKTGKQDVILSYGGKEISFEIEVEEVALSRIEISSLPKTEYFVNDVLEIAGLELNALFNDGSSKQIWQGLEFIFDGRAVTESALPILPTTGEKTVTVLYSFGGRRVSTSYSIYVNKVETDRIEISKDPDKTIYKLNEQFDPEGMILRVVSNNGAYNDITSNFTWQVDTSVPGSRTVTISYNNHYAELEIYVISPITLNIISYPDKTQYIGGEEIDLQGIKLQGVYFDGTVCDISVEDCDVHLREETDGESITVTVSYFGASASFAVGVAAKAYFTISSESQKAFPGTTVSVNIRILNNPGIMGMVAKLFFDDGLELLDAYLDGDSYDPEDPATEGFTLQKPNKLLSGQKFEWDAADNNTSDGILLTLVFNVPEDAEIGTVYNIGLSFEDDGIINKSGKAFSPVLIGGTIEAVDFILGDLDTNGKINLKDLMLLREYLVMDDEELAQQNKVNVKAANIDKIGRVNIQDLICLRKYFVGEYDLSDNAKRYAVIFDPNCGAGECFYEVYTVGTEYTLPQNTFARDGYTFNGWNTRADGKGSQYYDKEKVTNLSEENNSAVTLYAQWNCFSYAVNLDHQGANVYETDMFYEHYKVNFFKDINGTQAIDKIVPPQKTGYVFAGYYAKVTDNSTSDAKGESKYIDENGSIIAAASEFTEDTTIYALWLPAVYKITLDNQGADFSGTAAYYQKYKTGLYADAECEGIIERIETPQKTDYVFAGYYEYIENNGTPQASYENRIIDSEGNISADVLSFSSDKTLYALWTCVYTVKLDNQNAEIAGTDLFYEKYGGGFYSDASCDTSILTISVPKKTGYIFNGYYESVSDNSTVNAKGDIQKITADGTISAENDVFTKNTTLYALWTPITYTVNYKGNGSTGGITMQSEHIYGVNKNLTPNGFTRDGYTFVGWGASKDAKTAIYKDKESVVNLCKDNNGLITLYAIWEANTYYVSFNLNSSLLKRTPSFSETSIKVTYDQTVSFNSPSAEFYEFKGWYTEATGGIQVVNGSKWNINKDTTLYAHWEQLFKDCTYISTYEDLCDINNDLSGNYLLINDIDLYEGAKEHNGTGNWTPLGTFSGTFNGFGRKLHHLYFNDSVSTDDISYFGLFSMLDGATISNLIITCPEINISTASSGSKKGYLVGCIAGYAKSSYLTGNYVIGDEKDFLSGGYVKAIDPSGVIQGFSHAANICGAAKETTFVDNEATVPVTVKRASANGAMIVSWNFNDTCTFSNNEFQENVTVTSSALLGLGYTRSGGEYAYNGEGSVELP